jgi:hypothetical protein
MLLASNENNENKTVEIPLEVNVKEASSEEKFNFESVLEKAEQFISENEDSKLSVSNILDELDDLDASLENEVSEELKLGDKNIVDPAAIQEKEATPSSFRR